MKNRFIPLPIFLILFFPCLTYGHGFTPIPELLTTALLFGIGLLNGIGCAIFYVAAKRYTLWSKSKFVLFVLVFISSETLALGLHSLTWDLNVSWQYSLDAALLISIVFPTLFWVFRRYLKKTTNHKIVWKINAIVTCVLMGIFGTWFVSKNINTITNWFDPDAPSTEARKGRSGKLPRVSLPSLVRLRIQRDKVSDPCDGVPECIQPNQANDPCYGVPECVRPLGGWMNPGIKQDIILKKLGPPEKQSKGYFSQMSGQFEQSWLYPKQGIMFNMDGDDEMSIKTVDHIHIYSPSKLTTPEGIGIGSTVASVKTAYSGKIDTNDPHNDRIVIGSIYWGTIFVLKNNKVSEIYTGSWVE